MSERVYHAGPRRSKKRWTASNGWTGVSAIVSSRSEGIAPKVVEGARSFCLGEQKWCSGFEKESLAYYDERGGRVRAGALEHLQEMAETRTSQSSKARLEFGTTPQCDGDVGGVVGERI